MTKSPAPNLYSRYIIYLECLYKLYDSIAKGHHGDDIVRAIKMLEDYLNNPDYEEDRAQIERNTLQMTKLALRDMKQTKKLSFDHYFKDFRK